MHLDSSVIPKTSPVLVESFLARLEIVKFVRKFPFDFGVSPPVSVHFPTALNLNNALFLVIQGPEHFLEVLILLNILMSSQSVDHQALKNFIMSVIPASFSG